METVIEVKEGGWDLGGSRVVVDPVAKDLMEGAMVEGAGVHLKDANAEDAGEIEWARDGCRMERVDVDEMVGA